MRKTTVIARYLLIFALAVFCFFAVFSAFSSPTADAVLPQNYVDQVKNNDAPFSDDWQSSQDYLNLDAVKAVVAEWIANKSNNLAALERDPITIAVIDSGVNFGHEIFVGEYDENGVPVVLNEGIGEYDVFLRDGSGAIIGKNTVSAIGYVSTSIMDDAPDMHGTHVCGIIATLIHELDLEKYIKIMPIKASFPNNNGSSFRLSDLTAAINFALDNGADVVNMSLVGDGLGYSSMVSHAHAQRAVFVAAAGNGRMISGTRTGYDSASKKFYPAASSNVIGVMNYIYTASGEPELAESSNYGDSYDICAPGSLIWSANGSTNNSYKRLSGTSMASPIVAFAAGLLELKYRAFDATYSKTRITQGLMHCWSDTIIKNAYTLKALDLLKVAQYEVVKLSISTDIPTTQTLDEVGEITLTVSGVTADSDIAKLVWYKTENDVTTQLATGVASIKYKPVNSVGICTIVVACVDGDGVTIGSDSIDVIVDYAAITPENTSITVSNGSDNGVVNLNKGESTVFSFNLPQNASPNTVVMWYINGDYVYSGSEFSYDFANEGLYEVHAKVNGEFVGDLIIVTVIDEFFTPMVISSITISCLLVCAAIVVVIILATRHNKAKHDAQKQ